MNISLSEQIILAIVAEQPVHGYDIEKIIDKRGMRKWTDIGFSSIYYILDKLESKNFINNIKTGVAHKNQYSITDTGLKALRKATVELLANRQPANSHLLAGIAASDLLNDSEYAAALVRRQLKLARDLRILRSTSTSATLTPSARRLFELSDLLLQTELTWVTNEIGENNESNR